MGLLDGIAWEKEFGSEQNDIWKSKALIWWKNLNKSAQEIYADEYSKGKLSASDLDEEQVFEIYQNR